MPSINIRTTDNGFVVRVGGDLDDDTYRDKEFVFESAAKTRKLVNQFFNELQAQKNGEVL